MKILSLPSARGRRIKPEITYQSSTTDCGIACLKMLLAAFGIAASLDDIRSVARYSAGGITVGSMIRTAKAFGLNGRAVRAELDDLAQLSLPVVIHWRFNHFVILERMSGDRAIIVDPAKGRLNVSRGELSRSYTGIAVEFEKDPLAGEAPRAARGSIRPFLPHVPKFGLSAGLALALSLLSQALLIIVPLWTGSLIDDVVPNRLVSAIPLIAGFTAAMVIGIAVAEMVQKELLLRVGTLAYMSSSSKLVDHLFRLGYSFFGARRVNDLVSRVGHVRDVRDLIVEEAIPACIDGLFSLMILLVMFYINTTLGLISLCSIGGYAVLRILTNNRSAQLLHEHVQADVLERGHLYENIKGALTLKGSNCEPERISIWRSAMDRSAKTLVRRRRFQTRFVGVRSMISGLDQILHIAVAALLVIQGSISLGLVIAIMMLRQQLHSRALSLVDRASELFVIKIYAYRLSDVINAEPTSGWTVAAEPAQFRPDAALELRDIAFRYADASPDVLKGVSLALARGDFIAIRGGSGQGKSTLLKVLIGLLDPTAGEVLLGGRPLTQPGFRALRDRSGVVLQGEQLFSGTIIENISWFGCERDAARVSACAQAACIHDDIMAMPMGYHSVINDSIVNLSGGQVQRILLARALYREPDFLFLDEATSALDPRLEERVVDMLQSHPAAKICISHRSLMLERADIVYRLEGGMLFEEIDRRPEAMRCVGIAGE